jgi:hypothetical protein
MIITTARGLNSYLIENELDKTLIPIDTVDKILEALDSCVNNPVLFSKNSDLLSPKQTLDIDQLFDSFQLPQLIEESPDKVQSILYVDYAQKITTGALIEPPQTNLNQNSSLILQFLAHCERQKNATFYSREIYKYHLSRLERWANEKHLLDLTAEDINDWVIHLEQTGLSISSITKALSIAHLLFNYLRLEGYKTHNPIEELKFSSVKQILTEDDVDVLITTLDTYASKTNTSNSNNVEKQLNFHAHSQQFNHFSKHRRNPRIKMSLPLTLKAVTHSGEHIDLQTDTVEVSRCGATIRANFNIEVGTCVYIKMPFSDWLRAEVNGLWKDPADGDGRMGLKLISPRTWLGD